MRAEAYYEYSLVFRKIYLNFALRRLPQRDHPVFFLNLPGLRESAKVSTKHDLLRGRQLFRYFPGYFDPEQGHLIVELRLVNGALP